MQWQATNTFSSNNLNESRSCEQFIATFSRFGFRCVSWLSQLLWVECLSVCSTCGFVCACVVHTSLSLCCWVSVCVCVFQYVCVRMIWPVIVSWEKHRTGMKKKAVRHINSHKQAFCSLEHVVDFTARTDHLQMRLCVFVSQKCFIFVHECHTFLTANV